VSVSRDVGPAVPAPTAANPASLQLVSNWPRLRPRSLSGRLLRFGVSPWLMASDLAVVLIAALLTSATLAQTTLLAVAVLVLNQLGGLYASRLTLSVLDDMPSLLGRALVGGSLVLAVDALRAGNHASPHVIATAATYGTFVLLARAAAYGVVTQVRKLHLIGHPTLILGAGSVGGAIATTLAEHPEYGLVPVGFLDSDPLLEPHERPVPLLGGLDALGHVIQEFEVSEVIIAFGTERESSLIDVLRTCDRLRCEIFLVPRLFEMHSSAGAGVDSVWGMPLVRMRRATFRAPSWRAKRFLDVLVAGFSLLLLWPLMAVIALAVRLETGPGVLFRQERVGLDGRRFELLKFRTLVPAGADDSSTLWNIAGDHRLRRVGRLLRRTSLDELPQLWNVLVGHMSLVGPRPERPYFVAEFARSHPRYVHRHRVPAGLTGWAQVHGLRGDTSIADRAKFDNYYVENWSLWLDIKILLRTALSLVRGAG
jgi:exopolysaccharide biosynthesis polyprenyl glycosylphosphotransferase